MRISESIFRATLIGLFTVAVTHPGAGQRIVGAVVDSTTGLPVGRGFVVLLDRDGIELGRMLTSVDGDFGFDVAGPGDFTLRSERIAYRPAEVSVANVSADEIRAVTLRPAAIPIRLAAIEVETESQCRVRPEEGRNTAALWEEASKALRAASWSADVDLYVHTIHRYERSLDLRRRRVTSERIRVRSGNYRTPFVSVDPDELMETGYVVTGADGTWYHAPDANTMLHESFVSTHCFRVTRDRNRRGMIGLAFQPVPDRRLPDVAGVLWLDQETWELRSIDYSYRRLANGVRDERVGGTIEFLVLPSGAWIVHRWQIRAPQLVRYEDPRTGHIGPAVLGGFQDTGGHVTRIETPEGEVLYISPDLVTLAGTVFDSVRGRPLSEATVAIDGTGYSATTGPLGEFEISALLDGEYLVSFDHPRLDSLGFFPEPTPVELRPGGRSAVDLYLPTEDVIVDRLCGDVPGGSGSRVLVGMVRNATNGRGVADVPVTATWQYISGIVTDRQLRGIGQSAGTTSDVWGQFVLCNLPMGRMIDIQATRDSVNYGIASVRFSEGQADALDAISRRIPPTGFYMPGRIWSMDLVLFPPRCIDRRRLAGSMLVEIIVTCEVQGLARRRPRRRNE